VFYVQIDTAAGTANLYLAGDAIFTGGVNIGSGDSVFGADGDNGIHLGDAVFADAPFSVTLSGALTAQNAEIIGDILAGSTFTVATGSNTVRADSNGLYVGSSAFATAPFRASLSGAVTATDITMTGNSTITGGTITGGTIRTAASGERIVITDDSLKTYNSLGNLNGPSWGSAGNTYGDVSLYDDGTEVLQFYNNLLGAGYTIRPVNGAALYLGHGTSGEYVYAQGNWDFNTATVSGLSADTTADHSHTVTIGTATYTTSLAGSHGHAVS
jgi:hypothetical protein